MYNYYDRQSLDDDPVAVGLALPLELHWGVDRRVEDGMVREDSSVVELVFSSPALTPTTLSPHHYSPRLFLLLALSLILLVEHLDGLDFEGEFRPPALEGGGSGEFLTAVVHR